MDENTLQIDIYYRLVSLLAEDYLFEGVNCCLFEMFKKIKKKNLSISMSVHSTFCKIMWEFPSAWRDFVRKGHFNIWS